MNKTLKMILISVLVVIAVGAQYVSIKSSSPLFYYSDGGYIELLDNPCLSDSSKKMVVMTVSSNGTVHTAHGCYYIDSSDVVHLGVSTETIPYNLSEFSHELPPLDIRGL
ncbi:MAG: hypothetical protein JHC33_04370 [Ignisphaera sp.]|nr:hypothetical protein [Ignisphaera sp.]